MCSDCFLCPEYSKSLLWPGCLIGISRSTAAYNWHMAGGICNPACELFLVEALLSTTGWYNKPNLQPVN